MAGSPYGSTNNAASGSRRTARACRPDVVSLGVELPDGTFTSLAALDGRCPPTEVADDFIGRVVGPHGAHVNHFDLFGYEPLTA
ncbi:hypothetical protein [Streptomyces olivochromogenes]|uniref:hypothetical protein n=1 Tax=Streptomyces olivochromogenes TaxID=1963 RepID=UPI00369A6387